MFAAVFLDAFIDASLAYSKVREIVFDGIVLPRKSVTFKVNIIGA